MGLRARTSHRIGLSQQSCRTSPPNGFISPASSMSLESAWLHEPASTTSTTLNGSTLEVESRSRDTLSKCRKNILQAVKSNLRTPDHFDRKPNSKKSLSTWTSTPACTKKSLTSRAVLLAKIKQSSTTTSQRCVWQGVDYGVLFGERDSAEQTE
jgi:hypothetical protein